VVFSLAALTINKMVDDIVSENCQILWVDFRYEKSKPCVDEELARDYEIVVIDSSCALNAVIDSLNPKLICFDYDLPDQYGLEQLQKTKERYPILPALMITDDHCIDLSIWALRSRVWDYFLKPVSIEVVLASAEVILKKSLDNNKTRACCNWRQSGVPSENRPYKTKENRMLTICVVDFVKQNLENKIAVDNMAMKCGMSKSHFSRTFKKEHDITFQEFLIQQRMNKAVKLLKNSDLHVTQIAHAVGYCELSNFTSTFQRIIGIRPSSFRKALMPKHFKNQVYN
jgi:AraC-like DNA-binding protein